MLICLPGLKAEKILNEGNYDDSDPNQVHDLFMAAYGDPALAENKRIEALERWVDKKIASGGK